MDTYGNPSIVQINTYGNPSIVQMNTYGNPSIVQMNTYGNPIIVQMNTYGNPSIVQMDTYGNPSIVQTVLASFLSQFVSQTDFHSPATLTSTLPSNEFDPLISLTEIPPVKCDK
jgi:hypothetical protein